MRRGERWRSERERDQTEGGKQRPLKLDGTYSCKQSLWKTRVSCHKSENVRSSYIALTLISCFVPRVRREDGVCAQWLTLHKSVTELDATRSLINRAGGTRAVGQSLLR